MIGRFVGSGVAGAAGRAKTLKPVDKIINERSKVTIRTLQKKNLSSRSGRETVTEMF